MELMESTNGMGMELFDGINGMEVWAALSHQTTSANFIPQSNQSN